MNVRKEIGGLLGARMRGRYGSKLNPPRREPFEGLYRRAQADKEMRDEYDQIERRSEEDAAAVEDVEARIDKEVPVEVDRVLARTGQSSYEDEEHFKEDMAMWDVASHMIQSLVDRDLLHDDNALLWEAQRADENGYPYNELMPKLIKLRDSRKRVGRVASLSVSQALEKAKSLVDGSILSQESYHDILSQVDTRDRYPFTVALVEHEIRVAERVQPIALTASEDIFFRGTADTGELVEMSQSDNGMYGMTLRDAQTGLVNGGETSKTLADLYAALASLGIKSVTRDDGKEFNLTGIFIGASRSAQGDPDLQKSREDAYQQVLAEIKSYGGSTHASLRDSVADYGIVTGRSAQQVYDDLLDAGVKELDAFGTVKAVYAGSGIQISRDPYKFVHRGAVNVVDEIEGPDRGQMTTPSEFPAGEEPSEEAGTSEHSWPTTRKVEGQNLQTFWDVATPEQAAQMQELVEAGDIEEAWQLLKSMSGAGTEREGEIGQSLTDLTTEKWAADEDVLRTGEYNGTVFLTLEQLDEKLTPCQKGGK